MDTRNDKHYLEESSKYPSKSVEAKERKDTQEDLYIIPEKIYHAKHEPRRGLETVMSFNSKKASMVKRNPSNASDKSHKSVGSFKSNASVKSGGVASSTSSNPYMKVHNIYSIHPQTEGRKKPRMKKGITSGLGSGTLGGAATGADSSKKLYDKIKVASDQKKISTIFTFNK